jgi:ubiquinone/menaquinone biosynthesis C-methylase UbiE
VGAKEWKEVYERLPQERKDRSLAEISGFDRFCDDPELLRRSVVNDLLEVSQVRPGSSVLEVGCGCADKLSLFYQSGYVCSGVDFSSSMIARARQEMPSAALHVGEALSLPMEDASQDLVFSYSVFFYFDSFEYAAMVLKEMWRVVKPGGTVCVWDIPDVGKKEEILRVRGLPASGYEHMYYDMEELVGWFKDSGAVQAEGVYRHKPFYQHSAYRFHITAKK